jgi:hypothetical protein
MGLVGVVNNASALDDWNNFCFLPLELLFIDSFGLRWVVEEENLIIWLYSTTWSFGADMWSA